MATYALNESKMFMDIADGIAIVINSETGIYYGLNAFGTLVLEALSKGVDSNALLQKIQALSGAPADIEQQFNAFLNELLHSELLIEGPAASADISVDEKVAVADQFKMEVKSYTDAQEMLLADPIHEVKEETGWTPEKKSIGYTKEETKERDKKMNPNA